MDYSTLIASHFDMANHFWIRAGEKRAMARKAATVETANAYHRQADYLEKEGNKHLDTADELSALLD